MPAEASTDGYLASPDGDVVWNNTRLVPEVDVDQIAAMKQRPGEVH